MLTCVVNKSFEPETKVKTFDKTLIGTVRRICETKCHSLRKKEIKVDEVFIPRWEDSPCCSLASEWDIFSGLCENWSLKLKRAKSLEGFPGSSAGKESACNAGDPLVQFLGQEDPLEKVTHSSILGLPGGSTGKESACSARDLGSTPGLGRSPGEGKGCPLQYSGLENSMDYSPWGHRIRHN